MKSRQVTSSGPKIARGQISLAVRASVGVRVAVGVSVGVGVSLGVGEAVGVCVSVAVGESVGDAVALGVGVSVGVGVEVCCPEHPVRTIKVISVNTSKVLRMGDPQPNNTAR